jgi:hypothetical protein
MIQPLMRAGDQRGSGFVNDPGYQDRGTLEAVWPSTWSKRSALRYLRQRNNASLQPGDVVLVGVMIVANVMSRLWFGKASGGVVIPGAFVVMCRRRSGWLGGGWMALRLAGVAMMRTRR